MTKLGTLWMIAIAMLLCLDARAAAGIALAPGDSAPELGGRLYPTNEPHKIDFSARTWTLVNFWATWCRPCRDEIPALEKLQTTHAEAGLEVVGVYEQETPIDGIKAFLEPFGVTYSIMKITPRTGLNWGGIGAIPTSFLIDRNGKILRRYVGATVEQIEGLAADVQALIDGRPMPKMVIPSVEPAQRP